jgi:NTP pyrophosphatase (non-canonical NTP hydrolase)
MNNKAATTLDDLTRLLVDFRNARDWEKFHNPKDLSLALSIEAAETLEHFLWKSCEEVEAMAANPSAVQEIRKEIADVLIFALLLAESLEIDPAEAVIKKIEENEKKYPVEKARGSARKYTEL